MYSVRIRDHIMIAHSLPDAFFGPASQLHGATYVVDAEFLSEKLNPQNVVIDIGYAHEALKSVLQKLNYRNLDEIEEFSGKLTTTEFLARAIHEKLAQKVGSQFSGKLKVTLGESHVAWASYESGVGSQEL